MARTKPKPLLTRPLPPLGHSAQCPPPKYSHQLTKHRMKHIQPQQSNTNHPPFENNNCCLRRLEPSMNSKAQNTLSIRIANAAIGRANSKPRKPSLVNAEQHASFESRTSRFAKKTAASCARPWTATSATISRKTATVEAWKTTPTDKTASPAFDVEAVGLGTLRRPAPAERKRKAAMSQMMKSLEIGMRMRMRVYLIPKAWMTSRKRR